MSRRPSASTNTISFRGTPSVLAKLDADCQRLEISRGELVRAIVSLHYDTQPAEFRSDLDKLLAKVSLISRNQARMLTTLLNAIGKLPLDDAKKITLSELLS